MPQARRRGRRGDVAPASLSLLAPDDDERLAKGRRNGTLGPGERRHDVAVVETHLAFARLLLAAQPADHVAARRADAVEVKAAANGEARRPARAGRYGGAPPHRSSGDS